MTCTTWRAPRPRGPAATAARHYEAELNQPTGIFTGGSAGDNLYIADTGNNRIQEGPFNGGTQHGVATMPARPPLWNPSMQCSCPSTTPRPTSPSPVRT